MIVARRECGTAPVRQNMFSLNSSGAPASRAAKARGLAAKWRKFCLAGALVILRDGTAKIWPLAGGEATATFQHGDSVTGAAVVADGEQLLTWSDDGTAKIWPLGGGEVIATFQHDRAVTGAAVLADGEQLLTWSDDDAKIWPLAGGEAIATFQHTH